MALHLLDARRLAEDLAAERVTPREQAIYLVASAVLWLIPGYFSIVRWPLSSDEPFASAYWWTEFAMLVLVNAAGTFYCLRQCARDPRRHFMIDFGCLYTPVAIVTVVATWAAFYAALWVLPRVVETVGGQLNPGEFQRLYARLHDLLLYLVIVGQVFAIYWGVGRCMRRTAELRT